MVPDRLTAPLAPLAAWRARRRQRRDVHQEYLRHTQRFSEELPFPPDGESFSIHRFLERLSERDKQGRRISAVPVKVNEDIRRDLQAVLDADCEILPYAVLVRRRRRDGKEEWEILYDEQTKRVQRWLLILHEVVHWLLGHACIELVGERLYPNLHQDFVVAAMARTRWRKDRQEQLTEWIARWLLGVLALGEPAEPQPVTWDRCRQSLRWSVMREAARHWTARLGQYRRLRPLWKALVDALDGLALPPPDSRIMAWLTPSGLRRRVERMALEIFDGIRDLRQWMDARIANHAAQRARAAGLAHSQAMAVADAAAIAAALQVRARVRAVLGERGDPAATAEPVHLACAADADPTVELGHQQLVARAFTGPVVRAVMADPAVQALLAELVEAALAYQPRLIQARAGGRAAALSSG